MSSLYKSQIYKNDLRTSVDSVVNFNRLNNKGVLITGATGLIGSYLVDMMMLANEEYDANITVYALGRSIKRLEERFSEVKSDKLVLVEHDVNDAMEFEYDADYLIHAASNAFPAAFNTDPVGTILSNVQGTYNVLEYGRTHGSSRILFVSSGEVYGQGDLSLDSYSENYSGYVNSVNSRSCYPNSKRCSETLCVSYAKQFGMDTVIVRPCHTYGPNCTSSDNRANVQFINNALNRQDIVLKSSGRQMRSYCYIADCASALLTVLINGESNEAYNLANSEAKVTIAEFAAIAAEMVGRKVVFECPDEIAIAEQTPIEKQILSAEKLMNLGWAGNYTVYRGIKNTIEILQEIKED